MKVLFVGAGAVGAVYAYHAHRGGAEVSFLVKPKYRSELEKGIRLYHHATFGKKTESIHFDSFSLLDDPTQVGQTKWDQIFIAVPSNAIYVGDWLKTLANHAGDATIVTLQPGLKDREYILSQTGISEDRLVSASIPILSYLAPLPGENFEKPGLAYWIPPGGFVFMSFGDESRRKAAIETLSRGGLKSRARPDFRKDSLIGEAILRLVVTGLEKSEWSWQRFKHGENILLASDSALESLPIIAKLRGVPDPSQSFVKRQLVKPFAIRSLMRVLELLAPFDIEAFFRVHFTKVEEQMRQGVLDLIEMGKKERLPTTSLSLLARKK